MKKILAVILSTMMVLPLAACGQAQDSGKSETATQASDNGTEETSSEEIIAGGYTDSASPVLTDDVKALFSKATETLAGVGYVPVAYLGSQVVAGTNHLILCKATYTVPDAVTTYAIVTLYEDLNGGAEITSVQASDATAPAEISDDVPVAGAVTETESPEVTKEASEALAKALENMDGASYEAKALLATQVVGGFNYTMLCKITPIVPDAVPHYSIVTVYASADGGAEITETHDFSAGDSDDAESEPQAETSNG